MLNRTFEIIDYFQPKHWFVENPHTARTKDYIHDKPFFVVKAAHEQGHINEHEHKVQGVGAPDGIGATKG